MIEVFKTDVIHQEHAEMLLDEIRLHFSYDANFDLEDCDNILRVKNVGGEVQADALIKFLNTLGFHAEILPDEVQPISDSPFFHSHKRHLI